jgi:hypothetical protein
MNKTSAYSILVTTVGNVNNAKPSSTCSNYAKYLIASLVTLLLIGGVIAIVLTMSVVRVASFTTTDVPIAATGTGELCSVDFGV